MDAAPPLPLVHKPRVLDRVPVRLVEELLRSLYEESRDNVGVLHEPLHLRAESLVVVLPVDASAEVPDNGLVQELPVKFSCGECHKEVR